MNETITCGELAERLGRSEDALRQMAKRKHWRWCKGKPSANGKPQRKYFLAALPAEFQAKLILAPSVPIESHPVIPASETQRTKFEEWVKSIAPLINCQKGQRSEIAEQVASATGLSVRTIWSRLKRFKSGTLVPKMRSDKGKSRFFEGHKAAQILIESKYCSERLSMRLAYEALVREWPCMSYEGEPPSYSTVRSHLLSLPNPLKILAREGERPFNEKCAPHIRRDYTQIPVMDLWVGDHGKHDVWVANDLWLDNPSAAVRPWLTAFADMRSRKIVGMTWCMEPSSHSISSALRFGIGRYGKPRALYLDNGKDFQKIGRTSLSPEAGGVCGRLGIKSTYCLPFHPQSKLIESFFSTIRKRFDPLWKPFYCGRLPSQRPEDCVMAMRQHEEFRKGTREKSPLPLASEFVKMALQWIEDYNANHEHSGHGMNHRTPDEIFDEGYPPSSRQPIDTRDLAPLLWDRARRLVQEGGCVRIHSAVYEPADPQSTVALFMRNGCEILVACDPYNMGEAAAFDEDGSFLGMLRSQQLLVQGPSSYEEVRASMRVRRHLRRGIKNYLASLSSAGFPTELQVLRQRALRTGTDDVSIRALAPGARGPKELPAAPSPRTHYAFVSDAVAVDAGIFDNIEMED
jgi:putative transposase